MQPPPNPPDGVSLNILAFGLFWYAAFTGVAHLFASIGDALQLKIIRVKRKRDDEPVEAFGESELSQRNTVR